MANAQFTIDTILDFLNANRIRATYGAVGEVLGIPAVAVSQHLGDPCPRESWIVSAKDGRPSEYAEEHMDPRLLNSAPPIRSGETLRDVMAGRLPVPFKGQLFAVSHADDAPFKGEGLRAFFEYRKMGIAEATNGNFDAHVIRAVPGRHSEAKWHVHDLNFQLVFVTKGWVVFEYEGQGEQILRAGSCVLQPPGIRHREVRHSDDMELIEIVSPAEFRTSEVDAPG